jgi:quinol monooxygenase YgiN
MSHITIGKTNPVITMVNVFTVESEKQQVFLDALRFELDTVMRQQPGFVSSSIHRSLDGVRVLNYTQWVSQEAFEASHRNAEYLALREANKDLFTSADQHLYTVEFTADLDGIRED